MSSSNQKLKLIFTGGGTGGHIYPIMAIIRQLKSIKKDYELEIYYIGPQDDFGEKLLKEEGVIIKKILGGKIRHYFSFKNIIDIFFKIPFSLLQAFYYLFVISPDLIFGKGGYGSFPVVFWSMLFQVPLFVHESDTSMGRANRFASHYALQIFKSFPLRTRKPQPKILQVGNPVRKKIIETDKEKGRKFFNLPEDKKCIFILGGSQGSRFINNVITEILPQLTDRFEIIHSCGEADYEDLKVGSQVILNAEQQKSYHLYDFLKEKEMTAAYGAADLIVSRAGSGSLFEIAALGKPSIIIPLSSAARNHQVENAYEFSKRDRAIVIEEGNLTPHFFLETIENLFDNPNILDNMSKKVHRFARPEAARIIASYINIYLSN